MILLANLSFEEFYYTEDNRLHDLDEVQKEYEQNNGDISKYRGQMFCPECKKAELSFTHKTSKRRAFLSKIPSSEHDEDCSFKHDSATKSEIKQIANGLTNEQIRDRLEAALNSLLPKKLKDDNDASDEPKGNPLITISNERKGSRIRKFIPRKSINSWFDKSEEEKIFIFYGHVKLEVEEFDTKNGRRFKLIVKTKKNNEWIRKTSIYRGTAKDDIDEEKIYEIAILGEIVFYNSFLQIKTVGFNSIMYRESKV